MKAGIGMIMWIYMISGLFQIDAAVVISNPGFEDNTGGGGSAAPWVNNGSSGTENWASHSGSWGMAVYGWGGSWGHFYQDAAIEAGKQYTFSIWVNKDATFAPETVDMEMEWYDSEMGAVGEETVALSSSLNDTWQQFSVTGTAPGSAAILRAFIDVTGITAGGAVKFDDASLTENSGAVPEPATFILVITGFFILRKWGRPVYGD